MQVFDDLEGDDLCIGEGAQQSRDAVEAGELGGTPAALPGDDLEAGFGAQLGAHGVGHFAADDGLHDAVLLDAVGKLGQRCGVEALARVGGGRVQHGGVRADQLAVVLGVVEGGHGGPQTGLISAPKLATATRLVAWISART